MDRLAVAGDHAALDEVDDAAGDQLGLHAEVVLVVEVHAERRRHRADAHLQGVAVVDQLGGDERADDLDGGDLLVAQRGRRRRRRRRVGLDDGVEPIDVDVVLAAGADEVLVDLGDDQLGVARQRPRQPHAGPEAAPAVAVGRRDRHEEDVGPRREAVGHGVGLPEPDRQVLDVAGVDGGPVERRRVVVVEVDGAEHVRLAPRRQPGRVVDADVTQPAGRGCGPSARGTACAACT